MNQALERGEFESFSYDDQLIKMFLYATLIWGVVALSAGVWIAWELANWKFNLGIPYTTFGRLRPIHTNAAIFAFTGNAIFAGVYHSTQRLLKARLYSDFLGRLHFWLWQAIIVAAAITLALGYSQSKEYAELEWPIDIAVVIAWVAFAVNFFGTLIKRRERHIYVAIWFYIATIITVALLYIVNNLHFPVSFMKSYSVFAGVQDALVQWWYGHNAVAFFLTTPFLGLMYYYVPKAAKRPIYSYRLSIIHFWSLIFIYIWAGPHHLLYTALPEWVQTLGMIFSIALWAPSWGGMINGLLTMRGAWDRVRTDPVLKFLATAITFYGMATFEGPLLSIKSVNALAHFTDWIVGHVHAGTIGWNYMMISALLYYIIPSIFRTELYSRKLANTQFWLATIGLLLYIISMWVAGITQGSMWNAIDATGKLVYPNFVETVIKIVPMYYVRAVGGTLVLLGFVILVYNIYKTIRLAPKGVQDPVFEAPALAHGQGHEPNATFHRKLEGLPIVFSVLAFIAVFVGGFIEIVPSLLSSSFIERRPEIKPYTPLEIAGRDIYVSEGCYVCHSQTVRPMAAENLRYGAVSEAAESIYDRPFQWGSRRIGPDLARVGGKYNNLWHYRHMLDPRQVTQGSLMPEYPWMFKKRVDLKVLPKKLAVLAAMGTPYSQEEIDNSTAAAQEQALEIARDLNATGGIDEKVADKQIVALIAYLQRLGADLARAHKAEEVVND